MQTNARTKVVRIRVVRRGVSRCRNLISGRIFCEKAVIAANCLHPVETISVAVERSIPSPASCRIVESPIPLVAQAKIQGQVIGDLPIVLNVHPEIRDFGVPLARPGGFANRRRISQKEVGEIVASESIGETPGTISTGVKHIRSKLARIAANFEGMPPVIPDETLLELVFIHGPVIRCGIARGKQARDTDAGDGPEQRIDRRQSVVDAGCGDEILAIGVRSEKIAVARIADTHAIHNRRGETWFNGGLAPCARQVDVRPPGRVRARGRSRRLTVSSWQTDSAPKRFYLSDVIVHPTHCVVPLLASAGHVVVNKIACRVLIVRIGKERQQLRRDWVKARCRNLVIQERRIPAAGSRIIVVNVPCFWLAVGTRPTGGLPVEACCNPS